jgi:hypothetical protein
MTSLAASGPTCPRTRPNSVLALCRMGVEAPSAAPALTSLQRRQRERLRTAQEALRMFSYMLHWSRLGSRISQLTPPYSPGRPARTSRSTPRRRTLQGLWRRSPRSPFPRFCLFTISSARSMLSACTATLKRAAPLIAWTEIFSISHPPYDVRSALDQFAAITTNLKAAGIWVKARRECRDQPRPTVGLYWMCAFPLFAAALASPSPRCSCFA